MKLALLDAKIFSDDISFDFFNQFGDFTIYKTTKLSEKYERVKDLDIILTNKVLFNREILEKLPKLKYIGITATGTNNIDLEAAKELGIAVTNVAGYSTHSVAQHTFSMLLYLNDKIRYYDDYVKNGHYIKSDIICHIDEKFHELYKKNWGIIGLGNIGRRVAEIALAFGCNVFYYSTSGKNSTSDFHRLELDELLAKCDIISIHSPLNEQTHNLITIKELKKMKKSAFIINVGRGAIVNEQDLAVALNENMIAGAGLDVLENEPINSDNPLLKLKNPSKLLITPHTGWSSIEARKNLMNEVSENIKSFLNGGFRNRVEI